MASQDKCIPARFEGISRVNQVRQTRRIRTVEEDGFELGSDIIPSQAPVKNSLPTSAEQRAINAYRATLPAEFERGPLFHARQIKARGQALHLT